VSDEPWLETEVIKKYFHRIIESSLEFISHTIEMWLAVITFYLLTAGLKIIFPEGSQIYKISQIAEQWTFIIIYILIALGLIRFFYKRLMNLGNRNGNTTVVFVS